MTPEEESKLRHIIRTYGFLDPLTVRPFPDRMGFFQVIDGEHRLAIGAGEGIEDFPCWVVEADDTTARELTPILNEMRGHHDEKKLGSLLSDLMKRRDEDSLRAVMPFSKDRFDQLVGVKSIDWGALEQKRVTGNGAGQPSGERWVERVYRMPADVAEVVDQAIAKAREEADVKNDWQGLEILAAEYMGS
jgi:hypothetical protein